jgi:hypothetical protein
MICAQNFAGSCRFPLFVRQVELLARARRNGRLREASRSVMMRQWILPVLLFLASAAQAQTPAPSATPTPTAHIPIWRCELPGGSYEVAIRAVVSVSMHEYVVDGAARVNELNIDTDGNMAVRFYYLEPTAAKSPVGLGQSAIDRATDLAKEAAGRMGADQVWDRVVKNYPTTTHAHTVEYRIGSEEQLKQIFASAQRAFESGRSDTYHAPQPPQ